MNNPKQVLALAGTFSEPILIVEDKVENQVLLQGICKKLNVQCDVASNGKEALALLETKSYAVFIVDLMMPIMDGRTFVKELKKINSSAVIIIQTALDTPDTIIELMKKGVYDYIIKPIDPELFQEVLLKALEYKYLKDQEHQQSLNAGEKIKAQIDWLNYKENRRLTSRDTAESKSVYNVKTSLAQGAGFGTLITLIDIMKASSAELEDGKVSVDRDVLDMMITNNDYCRAQIDGLNFATRIMERDFEFENFNISTFISEIPKMTKRVIPFLKEKNLKITFPEQTDDAKLRYNKKAISLVVEEMLVNAYKYSKKNTIINIFARYREGYFWFSVKNSIDGDSYGGVPPEYEKLVLEPFFRIHPPDETVSKVERIGFGLGLAVADYVAKKHGGIYIIRDVKDMLKKDPEPCVLAELLLPVFG
ncbi:MAG: response regulator [Spirochaetes bacterium]|jgi:CheY-like chemotaxis protein|nr:response regulator [Spirochaetota bacterium]